MPGLGFLAHRAESTNSTSREQAPREQPNTTSRSSRKLRPTSQQKSKRAKKPKRTKHAIPEEVAQPAIPEEVAQPAIPEEVVPKGRLISLKKLPAPAMLPAPKPNPETTQQIKEGGNKTFKTRKLRRGYRQKTKNRKIKKRKTKKNY